MDFPVCLPNSSLELAEKKFILVLLSSESLNPYNHTLGGTPKAIIHGLLAFDFGMSSETNR